VSASELVVRTRALTKRFGGLKAVDGLDLTVRRGDVYGFLGLNGAGKTTTIRMLLGLAAPDGGSVELFDQPMRPGMTRPLERIGALLETTGAYGNLTVRENLRLRQQAFGLEERQIDGAMELMHLKAYANVRAAGLSAGNRQRLGLAVAVLHEPELLILDEPTNRLDPAGIADMRALIERLSASLGITVFLSSHILAEVQQLATRIGVMHQGRLVEEIDHGELRRRSRAYLEFRVDDTARSAWVLEEQLHLDEFTIHDAGSVRVYSDLDRAAAMNGALVAAGVGVSALRLRESGLEEHFMRLTGGAGE